MEQSGKIGAYSLVVNVLLVVMKGLLSLISGSVALFTDAIRSSADTITSATVLAGTKISKKKLKKLPYGLYKVGNFISLLLSLFLFFAGYEIIRIIFFEPQSLRSEYLPYAIIGVILTMATTYAFSRYELRIGEEIASPSLIAQAKHIWIDMLSSGVILVGLVAGMFGLNLDKIASFVVVLLIFKAGLRIFIDAMRVFLDASIDFSTMDRVKSIILNDPKVAVVSNLWGRNSGPYKFIEADIVIKTRNLEKAHIASQRIEKNIRGQVSNIDHILIHYEPLQKETSTFAVPLQENKKGLSAYFGEAPYFYIATRRINDDTLLSENYCHNPCEKGGKGKDVKLSEWLLEKGVDTVYYSPKAFRRKGPNYVFSDAEVDVIVTAANTVSEIQRNTYKC
jgi:cation diffusion facilitator family transporter